MNQEEQIIRTEYSELMQKSYIDYAMSVIIARALPDVRDGLKPVQRRTLYDMYELGIRYDKPYRKCARIVGDTMGKYHPHGDSSIYDALVVMAQDFKKGLPLVDGHGNFGSIEGDGAAAMRYTEARLQKITQEAYLADLDKDVVNFVPNFDETEKEPEVLPVKVPNLLLNGAEGIAVGMTTSIPPHNFGEVIDGVIAYMKDPDINTEQMMQYIPGPDFPTGAQIMGTSGIRAAYTTGRGKLKIRARAEIEPWKETRERIIVTEIPYMVNKARLIEKIADLVHEKRIDGISDLRYPRAVHGKRNQLLHTVWRRQYAAPSCMFSSFLHYDRADYYFNQSSCPAPAGSYHDAPAHSCKHTPGNQKLPAGHFIRTFFYFPVQLFLIAASCFGEFPCAASFPCAFRAHEYRA